MRGSIGGYLGAILGLSGWLIGFTGFCAFTGNLDVLAKFFLPGLAVSLSMGFVLVVAVEGILRVYGHGHYMFSTTLWGLLLSDAGVLLLLMNHWIAPILDQDPRMIEAMRQYGGGVYRTGETLPLVSLCAGAALLGAVAWKVLRDAAHRPAGETRVRPAPPPGA